MIGKREVEEKRRSERSIMRKRKGMKRRRRRRRRWRWLSATDLVGLK